MTCMRLVSHNAMLGTALGSTLIAVLCAFPVPAGAATPMESAKANLANVYAARADLRAAFREDGTAVSSMRAAGLASLEAWAEKYGYKEHPTLLSWYAPALPSVAKPAALKVRTAPRVPVLVPGATFDFSKITAEAVLVIDDATREVLLARNSRKTHPIASITKLMTAMVALEHRIPMARTSSILDSDEVGGARLRVENGTSLTVRQIFDAMLVGSANNAANALARSTKLAKEDFIAQMNARAAELGLGATTFVDPTGIEVGNVSTAEEVAALAFEAFAVPDIRRATTTSQVEIVAAKSTHKFKNTNELLTNEGNGLYVLGGKTGYLIESKWNLAVKIRDSRMKPVLVVVLGSTDKARSFKDAEVAAKWVWNNYRWTAKK
jgi:serine-type D-Ala-D-Ala endopeptidase (penicillin-binding protein 7)